MRAEVVASVTTRKGGSRFISFVGKAGKPQFIHLGNVPVRYAEAINVKVEDLVSACMAGHAPSGETSRWLAEIDDRLHAKLVKVQLAQPRQRVNLKAWLDQYTKERTGDLKPGSLRKMKQTTAKLLAFFDGERPLQSMTAQDASDWRQHLKAAKLSEAAIKTHCGNAKTIMAEAVRRKMIDESPFRYLKSGPTPSAYARYVTPEEIERVIASCPNSEWRLLFGLARYAGLRVPSETHLLTWASVDWKNARLVVQSPKTERHAGHEQRFVPISPRLMAILNDRFDECADREVHLVQIRGGGGPRRQVQAICRRAGVAQWERLWQTLRQSCEKEWAMIFPQYAVSRWIGHSITVSGRHYANHVPDELFRKAAGLAPVSANGASAGGRSEGGAKASPEKAQRQAQQKAHETARTGRKTETAAGSPGGRNSRVCEDLRRSSSGFEIATDWRRGELNPRPATDPGALLRA